MIFKCNFRKKIILNSCKSCHFQFSDFSKDSSVVCSCWPTIKVVTNASKHVYAGATDEISSEENYTFTQEVTAKTASELNFTLNGYSFKYWALKDEKGNILINEIKIPVLSAVVDQPLKL